MCPEEECLHQWEMALQQSKELYNFLIMVPFLLYSAPQGSLFILLLVLFWVVLFLWRLFYGIWAYWISTSLWARNLASCLLSLPNTVLLQIWQSKHETNVIYSLFNRLVIYRIMLLLCAIVLFQLSKNQTEAWWLVQVKFLCFSGLLFEMWSNAHCLRLHLFLLLVSSMDGDYFVNV